MNKPHKTNNHYLFWAFALSLLMIVPVSLSAQGPGRRAYLAGENLRKQNKCRDAIQQYDEAIKLEPANYKYYFQRGKCEYKLKDYESAKGSFESTAEYKKDFTPAYSLLAKIYKNEKDYTNAIFYYEEAAKYEMNSARKVQYKLLLVNLLLKEDRITDARTHIADAKNIDPTNPNILFYEAEIMSMQKNWDGARRSYEAALESERLSASSAGEKAKYYYGLGVALSNLGDAEGAKKAWSKANFGPYKALIAQQMRESNHVYYYKIAVSYYLNGEYDDAQQYLAQALELQKNFSSAYILKGKIANRQGNIGQAIQHYQRAIGMEKVPEKQAKMHLMIASLQLKSNDHGAALNSIQKAMSLNPKTSSGSMMFLKAKAEYGSGRYADAITTLESILAGGVDTKSKAKYSFMLGMAAKKIDDEDKAKDAFKSAMYGPYKPAARIELEKLTGKG